MTEQENFSFLSIQSKPLVQNIGLYKINKISDERVLEVTLAC